MATLAAVATLASVATLAAVAAALGCSCGFTLPSLLLDEAEYEKRWQDAAADAIRIGP